MTCDVEPFAGCPVENQVWREGYLLDPSSDALQLILGGGFSSEVALTGFGGAITLFVAGIGIGFSLKFLRRL